ncbi:MAG: hypothetical protein KGM96_01595 [Acidobacteriota bacterium]|nr:hypothetical protein [Acidobacteriota bacterium]
MDDFERELREAFERRPAPPSLKRRLMEQRRRQRPQGRAFVWQRLAASLALAAVLGGAFAWHRAEERRKGEEARRQVLTALRITNHALNEMNERLVSHDRNDQE